MSDSFLHAFLTTHFEAIRKDNEEIKKSLSNIESRLSKIESNIAKRKDTDNTQHQISVKKKKSDTLIQPPIIITKLHQPPVQIVKVSKKDLVANYVTSTENSEQALVWTKSITIDHLTNPTFEKLTNAKVAQLLMDDYIAQNPSQDFTDPGKREFWNQRTLRRIRTIKSNLKSDDKSIIETSNENTMENEEEIERELLADTSMIQVDYFKLTKDQLWSIATDDQKLQLGGKDLFAKRVFMLTNMIFADHMLSNMDAFYNELEPLILSVKPDLRPIFEGVKHKKKKGAIRDHWTLVPAIFIDQIRARLLSQFFELQFNPHYHCCETIILALYLYHPHKVFQYLEYGDNYKALHKTITFTNTFKPMQLIAMRCVWNGIALLPQNMFQHIKDEDVEGEGDEIVSGDEDMNDDTEMIHSSVVVDDKVQDVDFNAI